MSEFDRQQNSGEENPSSPISLSNDLPDDFSMEDVVFAQELEALFAPEQEELPPLFVQTLLEPDDPRFETVEHKFEQKTSARVFRRLKLRRRLFRSSVPSLQTLTEPIKTKKPLMGLLASCMVFMLLTMLATSCSFANGLNMLLAGPHSGAVQVFGYPTNLASHTRAKTQPNQYTMADIAQTNNIPLYQALRELQFPMYWPMTVPKNYLLTSMDMFQGADYTWANGPVLEMNYNDTTHDVSPKGTGQITICEFSPNGSVFQAVQDGSARSIQIYGSGNAQQSAVYVDGQWVRINKFSHDWLFGSRSEVIYERDGVVFWIAGDQRDGIDKDELIKIASSLQVFNVNLAMHSGSHSYTITTPANEANWLFANDVVYSDGPTGAVWERVGNVSTVGTTSKNSPTLISQRGDHRV